MSKGVHSEPVLTVENGSDYGAPSQQSEPVLIVEKGSDISTPFSTVNTGSDSEPVLNVWIF